jgi:zinc protease
MILLFSTASSISQNPSKQQQTDVIPLDSKVRYGKLDNGFTYYIKKNEKPKESVELRLVVKAGRIHEDENQVEYAHLLEHLLAGKTKNFPNIKDYFKKIGGYKNAHTGTRFTIYEARIPSHEKVVIKDVLRLLRDWAQGLDWDPDYLTVQRGAVEGEMRGSDPYGRWLSKSIEREVLKSTNYKVYNDAKHLMNLRIFNPEAFKRYYKDWYRPDLQAAIIVGDINVDSVEYEIKRRFINMEIPKNPKNANEKLDSQAIQLDGSIQFSTVHDSLRQELNLKIIRLRPNFESHVQTKDDYHKMLLQQLYKKILKEKAKQLEQQYDPPFASVSTNYVVNQIPDKQLDGTLVSQGLETKYLQLMKKQFQRSLTSWKQMHLAFTNADLKNAKTAILKRYTDNNLMNSKYLIRRYEEHFLYGKAAPNPEVELKLVSEIISEIELKDILEFISEHGDLDKNTFFIFFIGSNIDLPDHEVFKGWIKETDTMKIKPLPEENSIGSLAQVVDIPRENFKNEIVVTENEIGVSTLELSNRIKIVLKPTSPRTSFFEKRVSIQAFRPNQLPIQNRREYLAAQVAPEVLQFTGAGPYNKFQLDRFKHEKEITLNLRTTRDNQMIYATSKFEDISELFKLLYLYLTEPKEDPKAFQAWKMDQVDQLEGKGLRGSTNFIMDKITDFWYPQVPVLGMEDLEGLTQEQVFHAGKKWFSSIEDFTFIVTGDFDRDTLVPFLVNTLSAFPIKNNHPQASGTRFDFPLKRVKENLEFKNIDQVFVRLFFPIKVKRDIKTQIELQLISKALNERIYSRLRKGSYSPRASGDWLDVKNGIFAFQIDFDSALGNEEVMVRYAMEEFRKLRENGVEKEWLKTAINNELRSFESRFSDFGHFNFWPDYLQRKLEEGEDPVPGVLNYGTLLEHFVSLDDINAALIKYMSEEHLHQFLGYPEGRLEVK